MSKVDENFNNANIKYTSLTNLDTLLNVASQENYINKEDIIRIKQFRDNPSDETWIKY